MLLSSSSQVFLSSTAYHNGHKQTRPTMVPCFQSRQQLSGQTLPQKRLDGHLNRPVLIPHPVLLEGINQWSDGALISPLAPINQVLTQTAASTPSGRTVEIAALLERNTTREHKSLIVFKKWPFVASKSFLGVNGSRVLAFEFTWNETLFIVFSGNVRSWCRLRSINAKFY